MCFCIVVARIKVLAFFCLRVHAIMSLVTMMCIALNVICTPRLPAVDPCVKVRHVFATFWHSHQWFACDTLACCNYNFILPLHLCFQDSVGPFAMFFLFLVYERLPCRCCDAEAHQKQSWWSHFTTSGMFLTWGNGFGMITVIIWRWFNPICRKFSLTWSF